MLRAGIIAGMMLMTAGAAWGQTQPAPGGQGARPGGGMSFDPAAIRARIMQSVKTAVDCTEEEWKVLEPKLVKVMLLKMDAGELGGMTGGSRGRQVRGFIRMMLDPNGVPSTVDERLDELNKMIDENETSTDFYKNKVAQLRKARERVKEELKLAEKDVQSVLTLRQEAALVQMGILE
jgi:hypothetical protein